MKMDRVIAVRSNKTVYRDGDSTAKVFDSDFSKVAVLNEALNLAKIETTGIKVPKLREVTTYEGKWTIVNEYIPGKSLSRLMKENPDKVDEYLERLVRLHIEMHQVECPMLTNLTDKMQRKIRQTKLDATTRYELSTRLNGMERKAKVCHGDFCPSNVIITPDDEAYIIDWAHATQGNPDADVARTYLVFCLQGNFEWAEKYLKLMCDLGDTARQNVQRWLPILAASQSVKGISEQQELLARWTSIAEYE